MPAFSNQVFYPIFAFLMLFLMLVFVPRPDIKKWFWFSLLWGSGVDLFLILLFKLLNLYYYLQTSPFNFYGAPMWITLAWSPAIIIYLHFLPQRKEEYVFYIYLSAFALFGVFIGMFFTQVGLIKVVHWHELLRFPVQFLWLYGATIHYRALNKAEPETI